MALTETSLEKVERLLSKHARGEPLTWGEIWYVNATLLQRERADAIVAEFAKEMLDSYPGNFGAR